MSSQNNIKTAKYSLRIGAITSNIALKLLFFVQDCPLLVSNSGVKSVFKAHYVITTAGEQTAYWIET